MDAWGSPGRVLARHGVDGSSNIACGDRSADHFAAGSKAPVQTETFPMPTNYRIRLYDQKRIRPLRPHSAQYDPEQSVGTAQARPLGSAFQYNQLLPQGNDFQPQVMTRPNKASQPREPTQDKPKHESVLITRLEGALLVDSPDCVLLTYRTRMPCPAPLVSLEKPEPRIDVPPPFP